MLGLVGFKQDKSKL